MNRETILVSFDGLTAKQVSVKYREQCGNFAFANVRKGRLLIPVYDMTVGEEIWFVPYEIKYPKK